MKKKLVFDEKGLEAFIEFLKIVKDSQALTINSMSVTFENIDKQTTVEAAITVGRDHTGYYESTYAFEIDEKNFETNKE